MSQMTQEPVIPPWTLNWRMQRSLAHAGIGVEEMAREIGVTRQTVGRWLNGHGAPPRAGYLKFWAIRCGVPTDWLIEGKDDINVMYFARSRAA